MSRNVYSDEYLLDRLRWLADEVGRVPEKYDIQAYKTVPSVSTYQNRFGSLSSVLKLIGINPKIKKISKKEMLSLLKLKCEELGRSPTSREIKEDERLPCVATYIKNFKSYKNACRLVGFKNNRKDKISTKELKSKLIKLSNKLKRKPTSYDLLKSKTDMPSCSTYIRKLGPKWSDVIRKCLE